MKPRLASRATALLSVVLAARLVGLDLAVRGPRFYAQHPRALSFAASSVAIALLASRAPRAARCAFALLVGLAVAAELAFFRYFHASFDEQAAIATRSAWVDVRPFVVHASPALAATVLVVAALELGRMELDRARGARSSAFVRAALLAAILGLAFGGAFHDATAEVRSVVALRAFVRGTPREVARADHAPMPTLVSRRGELPDVLLVVTESVGAASFCGDTDAPCEASPKLAAALPSRVPLLEMRSVASYTAVSMSVLLTGATELASSEEAARAPDLFDYVRATRAGEGHMAAHYWSAHKSSFFARGNPRAAVDSFFDAEDLLGHPIEDVEDAVAAGLDRRVADACERRFPALRPPYLVVVHFSGTHAPYFFDEETAPHRPFTHVVTWEKLADLRRAYEDAILEQDESSARCVRAFLAAQAGRPHLVVFTSDHGEAFGEHAAIHHGQNLYDEQTHVPAFVYAGGGAIGDDEARALEQHRRAFVTHFDVLPTILDAIGLLPDDEGRAIGFPRASSLLGRSLLRPVEAARAVPISNCTALFPCPLNTWGVLDGSLKLTAQAWDGAWRCLDLAGGEHEVPLPACDALAFASRAFYERRPNGEPNGDGSEGKPAGPR